MEQRSPASARKMCFLRSLSRMASLRRVVSARLSISSKTSRSATRGVMAEIIGGQATVTVFSALRVALSTNVLVLDEGFVFAAIVARGSKTSVIDTAGAVLTRADPKQPRRQ
jgi:hypothetical protein